MAVTKIPRTHESLFIIAGFGGQGTLFAGKLIATAGLFEDREISWMPSYGPEMRGGTANCSVILSHKQIGSPLILYPNNLIAMNQPSFDKFQPAVKDGGIIVADSQLCPNLSERGGIELYSLPAQKIAEDNGFAGLGNVILLGLLQAKRPFCETENLVKAIEKCVPATKAAMVDMNKKALEIGLNA